jgi:HAD superfamily hydrolase (TIGR01509 family)
MSRSVTHSLPMLQAVMFDMDGVLVDSEPLWFEAESSVMARLGGNWTQADQHALVGGSMAATTRYLLSKGTRQASHAAVAHWLTETMIELLTTRPLPVLPGAAELVAEVAAAGLPYALVTSSEPEVVAAVLARLDTPFPVTVCGGDVSCAKPDPEGYLLAAAKLGVDPAHSIAVEDSPNGVSAAEAAGYLTVAVPGVVPIPERPGRLVVNSLAGLTLRGLRAAFGLGPS